MNEIQIGDIVVWESQSRGHYGKIKRGEVFHIVKAGCNPELPSRVRGFKILGTGFGMARKHDSYLVNVAGVAYWPRVKHLRVFSKATQ